MAAANRMTSKAITEGGVLDFIVERTNDAAERGLISDFLTNSRTLVKQSMR
jgi:hypothetical protein